MRDLAGRITGSFDLYGDDGRSAYNSLNFITCHDGFTLNDLVSFDRKHNEANLENNSDGTNDNNSWNCGCEGATDDENVIRLRKRLVKNYYCILLFSLGTPMVLGGDEFMRTQAGNNNAYCQDNEISWHDWTLAERNRDMVDFFRKAVRFRKAHTILQRRKFLYGIDSDGDSFADITWFGKNLDRPAWDDTEQKTLCYQLDGSEEKSDIGDYLLFFILNSDHRSQYIKLPVYNDIKWRRAVDTGLDSPEDFADDGNEVVIDPQDHYMANPRSVVVLIGT
jgi:glycogen operon protein